MAQERKAAHESATKKKKAKAQNGIMVDEGQVPTAEELRRRQMRAGRFGKEAVDHSVPVRAHAPVYAVCAFAIWPLSDFYIRVLQQCRPSCFHDCVIGPRAPLRHALVNRLLLCLHDAADIHRQ